MKNRRNFSPRIAGKWAVLCASIALAYFGTGMPVQAAFFYQLWGGESLRLLENNYEAYVDYVNPENSVWPNMGYPEPDAYLQSIASHQHYLVLESGEWILLTAEIYLACYDAPWGYISQNYDNENNQWLNETYWYCYRAWYMMEFHCDDPAVPAGGFPNGFRYWIVDSETGQWSDTIYAAEGFDHGFTLPGSGLPDLPVKVVTSELRVLNGAKVMGNLGVTGKVRVPPSGGLSMGEFTQGPQP